MVLGLCAAILLGGSFTLFAPFSEYGTQLRAKSAESRMSPEEIRARGGGSRGSVWSNIEGVKKRQKAEAAAILNPKSGDDAERS